MADIGGYELNLDFEDAIKSADILKRKMYEVAKASQSVVDTLEYFSLDDIGKNLNAGIFENIKAWMDKINKSKVSIDFDAKGANDLFSVMDSIVERMTNFTKNKIELFDTHNLYSTNESLLSLSEKANEIKEDIKQAIKDFSEQPAQFKKEKFVPPVNEKTGKEYSKNSLAYKKAKHEYDIEMTLQEQAFKKSEAIRLAKQRMEAEARMQELIEEKAIIDAKLDWAKKTEAERAEIVKKRIEKQKKEEQKAINEARAEYKKLISDQFDIIKKKSGLDKLDLTEEESSKARSEYDRQFEERDRRKRELESKYADFMVDIMEDANRKILDITSKRIAEEKKLKEEEYNKTPTGALEYANSAKTIEEFKKAQKYLLAARDTTDVSDKDTIDALNKKYQELRVSVEELTRVEKNEQTLQPTLRNEYARLLRELDKLEEARKRYAETSAFKKGDISAVENYDDIEARLGDVAGKIKDLEYAANPHLKQIDSLKQAYQEALEEYRKYNDEITALKESGQEVPYELYGNLFDADAKIGDIGYQINKLEETEGAFDEVKRKHAAERAARELADFEKLEAEKARIAVVSAGRAQKAIQDADDAQNIKQEEEAIKELIDMRDRLDRKDLDYENTLKTLNAEIEKHRNNVKQLTKTPATYGDAMDAAKNAKSVKDLIDAIKKLKEARDNLNKDTEGNKFNQRIRELNDQIKQSQRELDTLTGKAKSGFSALQKMWGRLVGMFSLAAIKGYTSRLISIRGEFEMQAKALEVLLRNKDEANELWRKTVQLAVKSPFTTKELITYTKQLSAYRIESEKLYETNQMLADISAGLGVDMNRLILAFGQVKAANFLRGTELRQFSEAGVNLLDKLAERFSALEGKAVSVDDVFSRISKRRVKFTDVEAVLKTFTDEGGEFYKMQEKQSETLKGMVMNLKDQIELMANDSGETMDGLLKGLIEMASWMVKNWRALVPILDGIAVIIVSNILRKGIVNIIRSVGFLSRDLKRMVGSLRVANAQASLFSKAMKAASMANAWLVVLEILASIGVALWQATTQVGKLDAALAKVDNDIATRLKESTSAFINLSKTINDSTKTTEEQNEALAKMQTIFKDILPDEMLQIDAIKKMGDNFTEATKALKEYYSALAYEQKKSEVKNAFRENIQTDVDEFYNNFEDSILNTMAGGGDAGKATAAVKDELIAGYPAVFEQITQEVEDGILKSTDDLYEIFKERLSKFAGVSEEVIDEIASNDAGVKWAHQFSDIEKEAAKVERRLSGLTGLVGETYQETMHSKGLVEAKEKTQELMDLWTNMYNIASKLAEDPKYDAAGAFASLFKELPSSLRNMSGFPALYSDIQNKLIKEVERGQFELATGSAAIKRIFVEQLADLSDDMSVVLLEKEKLTDSSNRLNAQLIINNDKTSKSLVSTAVKTNKTMVTLSNGAEMVFVKSSHAAKALSENLRNSLKSDELTKEGQYIIKVFEGVSQSMNIDPDIFAKFVPNAKEGLAGVRKAIASELDIMRDNLKDYKKIISGSFGGLFETMGLARLFLGGMTMEEYEKAIQALEKAKNAFGAGDNDSNKNNSKNNDVYSRRIKLVQDMRKSYEDLSKVFDKTTAQRKILNSFSDEAKELGIAIKDMDVSTIKGTLDALNAIESLVKKNKKAYVEFKEAKRDLELELEKSAKSEYIENLKRNMDDVFAKYDLGKELEKLHIPKELAMSLFDADVFNLEEAEKAIDTQSKGLISAVKEYRKTFKDTYAADKDEKERAEKAKKEIVDKFSKDEFDAAMDFLKKYEEAEKKSLEERLKNYAKYTEKALSSLGKINVNALNEMAEVEKLYEDIIKNLIEQTGQSKEDVLKSAAGQQATAFRDAAIDSINEKRKEDFDKEKWEIFKSTAMYEQMFDDISKMGELAVNQLLDNLRTLKGSLADLPFETRKAIEDSISKLEDRSREFNPFKTFKGDLKDIKKLQKVTYRKDKKTLTGRDALEANLGNVTAQITKDKERLAVLESINAAQENYASLILLGIDMNAAENQGLTAQEAVTKRIGKLRKDITDNEQKATDLGNDLSKFIDVLNSAEKVKKTTEDWAKELGSVLKSTDDILAAFGVAEDSAARIAIDMASALLDATVNAVSLYVQMELLKIEAKVLGKEMNMALGVIGWIAMALQAVASILTAVFQAHDKTLQRQIDSLADGVEKLEKEFEALEKSIEKAFDIAYLKADWNSAMTNIDQRIADTAEMISLEKKKKSTDDDAIKDYEDQLAELEEQRRELMEETIESLGGVVDFRSLTRGFVDAWYDAFKETGNGLEGLKENFTDFFANVVAEQAVMTGAGKIMQPLFDEINDALKGDFEITDQEYANIDAKQAEQLKKLDTFLTEYYEKYGNILTSGDKLSGLQKGIQGITEEQADILAAYWSSVRFFVANIDTTLTNLATHIFGQATATDNPMISQLKLIASNTTAINNLLDSVTKGGHPKGGQGIKVFIN